MNQFKRVARKRAPTDELSPCRSVPAGASTTIWRMSAQTSPYVFEMLGNSSPLRLFKEDAITFGWEFLTRRSGWRRIGCVTIFRDDDEADQMRKKVGSLPADRTVRREGQLLADGDTDPWALRGITLTRVCLYRATIGRTVKAIASSRSESRSCSSIGMPRGSCILAQAQHRWVWIGTAGAVAQGAQ
jgi:hypothetical protein